MSPSLSSCLSQREGRNLKVRFDFTEELPTLQMTRNPLDGALMPSCLAGGSTYPVLRY